MLVSAFEEHLAAVQQRRGEQDVAVDDAYDALAEAFDRYEAAMDVEHGESLPMLLDEDGDLEEELDELDPHAEEDEDELDDDVVDFDLERE